MSEQTFTPDNDAIATLTEIARKHFIFQGFGVEGSRRKAQELIAASRSEKPTSEPYPFLAIGLLDMKNREHTISLEGAPLIPNGQHILYITKKGAP